MPGKAARPTLMFTMNEHNGVKFFQQIRALAMGNPKLRESARFHSTWVKETMPVVEGTAGQVDEVPVAVEVKAEVLR